MIDVEFYDNERIKESWKLLLDCYNSYPQDSNAPDFKAKLDSCNEKSKDLFTDLIYEMAESLGYHYDKVHLKRGVYLPKGHADLMFDQEIIRRSLVDVLLGRKPFPITIIGGQGIEEKKTN